MGAIRKVAAGLRALDGTLARIEAALLVVFLGALVLGGFWQVLARNVNLIRGLSFKLPTASWIETVLRHLVMWIGLIGASLATRHRKHVSIEVIGSHLPRWAHRPLRALLAFAAGLVAALFAWTAWQFVAAERADPTKILFRIEALRWAVRPWTAQVILPGAFALITARFLAHATAEALGIAQPLHDEAVHLGDGELVPDFGLLPGETSTPGCEGEGDGGAAPPAPSGATP